MRANAVAPALVHRSKKKCDGVNPTNPYKSLLFTDGNQFTWLTQ